MESCNLLCGRNMKTKEVEEVDGEEEKQGEVKGVVRGDRGRTDRHLINAVHNAHATGRCAPYGLLY